MECVDIDSRPGFVELVLHFLDVGRKRTRNHGRLRLVLEQEPERLSVGGRVGLHVTSGWRRRHRLDCRGWGLE
jgi:hypothetical protein